MKLLNQGVALAVIGAGLAAAPALHAVAGAAPPPAADNGVRAMRNEADGAVVVSGERSTGKVGFIRLGGQGDLLPSVGATTAAAATDKVDAYLDKYAANFGARAGELTPARVDRDGGGFTVTYTQEYRGVPVFGSMLRAHIDGQGDLTAVNGYAAPDLDLSTTPRLTASEAAARALGTVRRDPPGQDGVTDTSGIRADGTTLVVYRLGSTQGVAGEPVLAYAVEVTNGANVRDVVILDAGSGKVVNRYSMLDDALERHLIEANGSADPATFVEVWQEGDPFPGPLNADQRNEVLGTGEAYWFFENVFGRDSYDGAGHPMTTVNNDGRINCPNANWNGSTTNYCNGVTSDDVVAHEWGHAYTEFTHALIYQWQSGALNEAYSDIWGETVDLINGRLDEGEGDLTARRTSDLCATDGPRAVQLVINSPAAIRKICLAGPAAWAALPDTTGITGDIVLAQDPADAAGPSTRDGCSPLTNAAAMSGHIGLVFRGTCAFTQKAQNLRGAGATAVVIGNNNNGGPFSPGGGLTPPLDVPVIGISQADADRVVGGLATGAVNTTVRLSGTAQTVDSFRWLMGEKATAFGGAIRDMWAPTCAGDPGKVSDAEYHCSIDDAGGVHSNSGVPNHGYALLVDGGTFNGQAVTGIGLDKAAAIYFRAMTVYQTPTTDFKDHADALLASCTDLVGRPINRLTVAPNATPTPAAPVTAADCASITAMIAAVELRADPTVQCNWTPLLAKNAPSVCGPGFTTRTLFSDDFEQGLTRWTRDQEVAFPGATGIPWNTTRVVPGRDAVGRAAVGPTPDAGECSGTATDISGRDSLVSPAVSVPGGPALRLSFDHYVATEAGFDGGNVKLSINGGPFSVVAPAAYVFNGPNTTFEPAAVNTNPMAGQPAFSGTDPGSTAGSWGQSQVDLAAAGVQPGDTVRVRFDVGRDGCGGIDAWYVDNVALSVCDETDIAVSAVHRPEPSRFGRSSVVDVTVSRRSVGATPTGKVEVVDARGTKVAEGVLSAGRAALALPRNLPVGARVMTVKYLGGAGFKAASTSVRVTVEKARSVTRLTVRPRPVTGAESFRAIVKVTSASVATVRGKVRLAIDGRTLDRAVLRRGRAVFTVRKDYDPGRHRVVARYLGADTVARSQDVARVRVVR